MKQSPKLPAEKRRTQLIKAARKVFSRKGFAGATTEDIAHVAGLTKGALYFHFKSKEDIFFAVIKDINSSARESFLESIRNESDPEKALEKLVKAATSLVEGEACFTVEFWQKAHQVKRIREFLGREHKKLLDDIIEYLMKCSTLTRKETESLVQLLHIIFDGIVVRNCGFHGTINMNRLNKVIIEMTRLYLRKKKSA